MSEREIGSTNPSEFQPRSVGPVEPETKMWEGGFSPKAMYGAWLISSVISLAVILGLIVATIAGMSVESGSIFNDFQGS